MFARTHELGQSIEKLTKHCHNQKQSHPLHVHKSFWEPTIKSSNKQKTISTVAGFSATFPTKIISSSKAHEIAKNRAVFALLPNTRKEAKKQLSKFMRIRSERKKNFCRCFVYEKGLSSCLTLYLLSTFCFYFNACICALCKLVPRCR